jgi:hypothetical protein
MQTDDLGKSKENGPFGRHNPTLEDNIEMDLNK